MPFDGPQKLSLDPETNWVSLEGSFDWKDQARGIKPAVLELINASDEQLSAGNVGQALGVKRSIAHLACKWLVDDGAIMVRQQKTAGRPMDIFFRKALGELIQ